MVTRIWSAQYISLDGSFCSTEFKIWLEMEIPIMFCWLKTNSKWKWKLLSIEGTIDGIVTRQNSAVKHHFYAVSIAKQYRKCRIVIVNCRNSS